RDPVCAPHWDRLGAPAAGAPLRLGDDGMAAVAGLAGSWRLGAAARAAACRAARGGGDGGGAGGRPLPGRANEKRGSPTGPDAGDGGRRGSKQHLLVDGRGLPLSWALTGGNRNDITVGRAARPGAVGTRTPRQTEATARQCHRRPRL